MDRKLILENAQMSSRATDATGVFTYYVELDSANDSDALSRAAKLCPKIGSFFIDTDGGPGYDRFGPNISSIVSYKKHDLRVVEVRPYIKSGNASKVHVDVTVASRPPMVYESGVSLIQRRVDTYLHNATGVNNDISIVKQIKTNYKMPKNVLRYGDKTWPPTDTPLPTQAGQVLKYFYTETVRVTSTFYWFEVNPQKLRRVQRLYAGTINRGNFISGKTPTGQGGTERIKDSRLWLCTNAGATSQDNGMTYRVTGEWVYNPESWDPLVIHTMPGTNQPVVLSDSVVATLYDRLNDEVVPPPKPLPADTQGAIRVPEYYARQHVYLFDWLTSPEKNNIDQVISNA